MFRGPSDVLNAILFFTVNLHSSSFLLLAIRRFGDRARFLVEERRLEKATRPPTQLSFERVAVGRRAQHRRFFVAHRRRQPCRRRCVDQ